MDTVFQKATRQHTKHHNSRLVLRAIYDYTAISRADLARLTGLTRATVSEVVADLIRKQLVEEVGHGPTAVGRTPVLLSVASDTRQLVSIEVGSEFVRGAVVNLRGVIRDRIEVPLKQRNGAAIVAVLFETLAALLAQAASPILGIGIGAPGLINPTGNVRQAVNLSWHNLPLRDLVEQRYHLPVYVANDSHLAALAEYTFGIGPAAANLIVLLVGQGVGAGLVLDGQLFCGDMGGAGEIGHVVVVDNGELCRCGNHGCLETVASSRAIERQARALAQTDPASLLHRFAQRPEEITLDSVRQALLANDPGVHRLISDVGHYLGIAVAHMVGLLNVRRILIADWGAVLGPVLINAIREALHDRALHLLTHETEVDIAQLGFDTVLLGASALRLASELGLVGGSHPRSPPPRSEPPIQFLKTA